jgi:hypothetical protein
MNVTHIALPRDSFAVLVPFVSFCFQHAETYVLARGCLTDRRNGRLPQSRLGYGRTAT